MRLIGIVIMAVSLTGSGFALAERVKRRLSILMQWRQMIHYLKSQMLYSNATLPEAVFEVGKRFGTSEQEWEKYWEPAFFFLNISSMLEEKRNKPFSDLWQEEVEKIPSDVPLTQSDRGALESLGKNLGYADRNMQERTFLLYLEQLDETTAGVKKEAERLGKLYRTLGVAAGMFWFILLI